MPREYGAKYVVHFPFGAAPFQAQAEPLALASCALSPPCAFAQSSAIKVSLSRASGASRNPNHDDELESLDAAMGEQVSVVLRALELLEFTSL